MRRLLILCVALGIPGAFACGFHDGTGMDRGMLNFLYPGSLSVGTRTWMAQREGWLAADAPAEESPQARSAFGFLRAIAALRQWKSHIESAGTPRNLPALAVVLPGPMMWSRYEFRDGGIALTAHVDGPLPGDVVVVADALVLTALASERITLHDAREMGVIAFHGDADAIRAAVKALGT